MKTIRTVSVVLAVLSSNVWADAYEDGVKAYQAGNFQDALGIWTSLAKDGHVNAEFQLGVMYEYGDGVSANPGIALEWYQRAAEHGHQQAEQFVTILRAINRGAPVVPSTRKVMRIAWQLAEKPPLPPGEGWREGIEHAQARDSKLLPHPDFSRREKEMSFSARC